MSKGSITGILALLLIGLVQFALGQTVHPDIGKTPVSKII